jgi:hypothetical protein
MDSILKISKQAKIVLIFIISIIITGFSIAWFYYDYRNKAEDPRVIDARMKLVRFDNLMKESKYSEAMPILDTVNDIYINTSGYKGSFEFGVIYNNRSTVYLSQALYDSSRFRGKDSLSFRKEKDSLLSLAEESVNISIKIYKNWLDSVGKMTKEQIRTNIEPSFNVNDPAFKGKNIKRIISKRLDDILFAQIETRRRLSVSYTNLGIIQRHQFKTEDAAKSYIEAIKLWKDNFTARNNFNVLMGKPPEDRSIIDKLFPPDRTKKEL